MTNSTQNDTKMGISRVQLDFQRAFELCVDETISDEQVSRVLEPVLKMIAEGRFKKQ